MNVDLKKNAICILSAILCFTHISINAGEEIIVENSEPQYYKGLEAFDAAGSYELELKQDIAYSQQAKSNLRELKEKFNTETYISKGVSEKNEIYLNLANILPAGTVFRIKNAHDNSEGNTVVVIETKEAIDASSIEAIDKILSISPEAQYLHTSIPTPDSDSSMESLPDGWNKELGYQEILRRLSEESETVKVSIVFDNPSNSRMGFSKKAYYKLVMELYDNKKGESFGLGVNKSQLAWWTQYISLEQLNSLYENEQVVSLVPRN